MVRVVFRISWRPPPAGRLLGASSGTGRTETSRRVFGSPPPAIRFIWEHFNIFLLKRKNPTNNFHLFWKAKSAVALLCITNHFYSWINIRFTRMSAGMNKNGWISDTQWEKWNVFDLQQSISPRLWVIAFLKLKPKLTLVRSKICFYRPSENTQPSLSCLPVAS